MKKYNYWCARDKNGCLYLYPHKPRKYDELGNKFEYWYDNTDDYVIVHENLLDKEQREYLSQIKWEDEEPKKVRIEFKIIQDDENV